MSFPRLRTVLLLLLLLLALAVGAVWLAIPRLLANAGVSIEQWQGLSVSRQGLTLEQMALQRQTPDGARLAIQLREVRVGWPEHADGRWRLKELAAGRIDVRQWPGESAEGEEVALPDLAQLNRWLALLPGRLALEQVFLELPCAREQRCTLNGSAHWQQIPGGAAALGGELRQGGQQLAFNGLLQPGDGQWRLQLDSFLDNEQLLSLDSTWAPGARQLSGSLASPAVPPVQAVRNWLGMWLPTPNLPLPIPEAGRLRLSWNTQLAGNAAWPDWPGLRDGRGNIDLSLQLPQPWPLPGLGNLQGDLRLIASGTDVGWRPSVLSGDLRLSDLYGDWLQALPVGLRPARLTLHMEPGVDEEAGSVRAELHAVGAADLLLRSRVALLEATPLALQLMDSRLEGKVPHLEVAGLRGDSSRLDLSFEGRIDQQSANVAFADGAQLQVGTLVGPQSLKASKLSAVLGKGALDLGYAADAPATLQLNAPLKLAVGELRQPHVKPLSWNALGTLAASLDSQQFKGRLLNSGGLNAEVDLNNSARQGVALVARQPEFFLRTGNPLEKSLGDWPALLSLNNGKASFDLNWRLPPGSAPQSLGLNLRGQGLEGVYDRSEVHGLDLQAKFALNGSQMELQLPQVKVASLNPGVTLGPLSLQGNYRGSLDAPLAGRVDWQQAELGMFNGRAWLPPGGVDLSARREGLTLKLEGLALEAILAAYPAEGLSGNGIIDGNLPLGLHEGKLVIHGGEVAARQPGVLQFRSEKIRSLGQSNPAMQLVATAIDDFRYDKLSSRVDYDESGKLLLALSLSGRNPALEQGRPINLNVNLEENVPKLLTSLQLSDRVSDTIRKRVQERLRNDPAAAP
ncbi:MULTISPECIES: intermembrane phospholipid transport protein YdbH family protein [Pseudomonas]|uniref:intermembrane phospholipid transport protein YdbH family protein n=1 Tax=Pseudomonas nitroreducens TaxID=46680 RepID=UPI001E4115F3|nr:MULTISPECIES: YdbH domain-containing protein [Pseudomonas]MCE4069164.1 YdbH domain-containing protein [Pseudomonas nitritireducens]MCE4078353.1 YdbH domain-containing protein [Pseudomonas nitroreducens]